MKYEISKEQKERLDQWHHQRPSVSQLEMFQKTNYTIRGLTYYGVQSEREDRAFWDRFKRMKKNEIQKISPTHF